MRDDGRYPLLTRLMRGFLEGGEFGGASDSSGTSFELDLHCLLDGIAARL